MWCLSSTIEITFARKKYSKLVEAFFLSQPKDLSAGICLLPVNDHMAKLRRIFAKKNIWKAKESLNRGHESLHAVYKPQNLKTFLFRNLFIQTHWKHLETKPCSPV